MIRELVEQHLIQEVGISKQKHPFKALMVTGPAGAGKTHTTKNLLKLPAYVRKFNLNPDDIIEDLFPKFDITLKFAHGKKDPLAAAQKELRNIAKVGTMSKAAGYINRAKPLFFDTTGEDVGKITAAIDQLVAIGYEVGIMKIFVPKETSVGRDINRPRTVGEPTPGIWDDYKKNVIEDEGYDKYAAGKEHVEVLNPTPFWNVFNLKDKDVYGKDEEGNKKLIAKARSKVEDVEGDFPVSIEEMDRVIADMDKATKDFLKPREVPNPIGAALYDGMLALTQHTDGLLGQEVTDFYKVGMLNPDLVDRSPEVSKAIKVLKEITGQDDLEKSFDAFEKMVRRAARGKEDDITADLGSRIIDKMKGFYPTGKDEDEERIGMVAEAIAKRLVEKLKIKRAGE
jgi:hypothetical protein